MIDLNRLSYDVSRCSGNQCPRKQLCARFTAPAGPRQAYTDFAATAGKDGCVAFITNGKAPA